MAGCAKVLILAAPERASDVQIAIEALNLQAIITSTTTEALRSVKEVGRDSLASVVCALGTCNDNSCWPLLEQLKTSGFKQTFVIVLSHTASGDAKLRMTCFDAGANMVTSSVQDTAVALGRVAAVLNGHGPYTCPSCGLSGRSEDSLHLHMHFHHAAEPNVQCPCPICGQRCENVQVHVHNEHGPAAEREPAAAPYAAFAWCVCQRPRDKKFLMVNEPAGISGGRPGYWLPAGRVDHNETLVEACRREALEEAGVVVQVTGVLRFMMDSRGTLRVVFLAVPEDDNCEPKSVPDWESVGALWTDVSDLDQLMQEDYRSPDPVDLFPKVACGALKGHSLDNDAFRELEVLMRRLTAGDKAARKELVGVWKRIEAEYPASVFARG